MPLISVIIPAYNAERFIEQCLQSVCVQTLSDIEIIVVDDGSTDRTADIVREYAAKDSRITLISQQNRYAGAARNRGLAVAKGTYLSFLDADDFFEPSMLLSLYERAEESNADVVVCGSSHYDEQTHEVKPIGFSLRFVEHDRVYSGVDLGKLLFRFCVGWPWDKLFRRSFVERHELQFQEQRTTNDAYFVFMALALSERIAFVDEPLAFHRTNNKESLEFTRSKSWENAVKASDSIEKGLRENKLYDVFEQAYLNWVINFSLWNYYSLTEEAKDGLLTWMESALVDKMPETPQDFFFEEEDGEACELLGEDRHQLLKRCLDMAPILKSVCGLKDENSSLQRMIKFEIDWRDKELAKDRTRISELQHEIESLRSSRAFRAGRLLSRALRPAGKLFSRFRGKLG